MGRFESRITIYRPLKVVFDTYTQPDTFRWADVRSVAWVHGKPWELESRMHIKTKDAFGVTMDQVVTPFRTLPPHRFHQPLRRDHPSNTSEFPGIVREKSQSSREFGINGDVPANGGLRNGP